MKTDSQIQTDVMNEMSWDPKVTHENIGISVKDGITTLSGQVPSFFEKQAAEKAAKRVAGVKAVVEKIEVKVPFHHKRDDQDIAQAILTQFKWNVQVPDGLLKVSVEDGWVEVTGEVEWDYQRNAAQKSIRGLAGVKGISNNITLKSKNVEASLIKQRIEDAFKREAETDARRIAVDVKGDRVTLSGNVNSFAELEEARLAAWCSPGVSRVETNLHVQGSY